MNLTVERIGNIINIFGYDEQKRLIKKEYYYYKINEAIRDFKSTFGLKYQRNINIKKVT